MPDLNEQTLYAELGRRCGLPEVAADTPLAEIGLDSVQWLDFVGWLADRGIAAVPATIAGAYTAGELHGRLSSARQPVSGPALDFAGEDPGSAGALLLGPAYELRPIDPGVMGFLYQLAISSEVGYRWRFRGAVPNYETFEASFWQGTLCQFVAVDRATGQPCGHVICYNPEMAHGYASVAAVFLPGHIGTGAPLQCVGSFVRYVFTVWPMRKLYLEVPSFNFGQLAAGRGRLFDEEGVLAEHDYYAGRYWDRHVLAVYRRHVGMTEINARAANG
jgi:RimJ/RimL family protein N-acetyltransferase